MSSSPTQTDFFEAKATGEPLRQDGPSRLTVPPLSLFSRQTSAERPSEPAASITSLCEAVVICPAREMAATRRNSSASVSRTSQANACRWRTAASSSARWRVSGVRAASASTAEVMWSDPWRSCGGFLDVAAGKGVAQLSTAVF
jgi:hypothetical protein